MSSLSINSVLTPATVETLLVTPTLPGPRRLRVNDDGNVGLKYLAGVGKLDNWFFLISRRQIKEWKYYIINATKNKYVKTHFYKNMCKGF